MSELERDIDTFQGEARVEEHGDVHIDRQEAALDAMTGVLLDKAMSPGDKEHALGKIVTTAECGTLEARVLLINAHGYARRGTTPSRALVEVRRARLTSV